MTATAVAARTCVIGVVSEAAICSRMRKPRSICAVLRKRFASYASPPNTLTTLWHSIVSCSTCTRSPIVRCAPRAILRRREAMVRTMRPIGGAMSTAIRVNFQFR